MQQPAHEDMLAIALAEQLKGSLLQINKLAESGANAEVALVSQHALRTIDAYTLGRDQSQLPLEPITAASVLHDAAYVLGPLARQLGYDLQIDTHGSQQPVLTNRQTLKDMLVLLATGLMQTATDNQDRLRLVLASHRSKQGTVVGVFSQSPELNQHTINIARRLSGKAHQTTPLLTASGGASLAIAMQLGLRLDTQLKARSHSGLRGIGGLFMQSKQLSLVP